MISDGPWRILQHALDRLGLKYESERLEKDRNDVKTVFEILLSAFGKTADSRFFYLFYDLTFPLLLAEARKFMTRLDLQGNPEPLVHHTLISIMNSQLSPRTSPTSNTWGNCVRSLRKACISAHFNEFRGIADKDESIVDGMGYPKSHSNVEKPHEDHGECRS